MRNMSYKIRFVKPLFNCQALRRCSLAFHGSLPFLSITCFQSLPLLVWWWVHARVGGARYRCVRMGQAPSGGGVLMGLLAHWWLVNPAMACLIGRGGKIAVARPNSDAISRERRGSWRLLGVLVDARRTDVQSGCLTLGPTEKIYFGYALSCPCSTVHVFHISLVEAIFISLS